MHINFKTVAELDGDMTGPERIALLETLVGQMNAHELGKWAETSRMKSLVSEAIRDAESEATND